MIITYECQCGTVFNGHWDQFPNIKRHLAIKRGILCPSCGNWEDKKNIDSDEVYHEEGE